MFRSSVARACSALVPAFIVAAFVVARELG